MGTYIIQSDRDIFEQFKLLTFRFGTQLGFSPRLILSISSARSLVSLLSNLYSDSSSSSGGAGPAVLSSNKGPSQNSVLMLSSDGFRMTISERPDSEHFWKLL